MVNPWWGLGVAVPAVALRMFGSGGKTKQEDEPLARWVMMPAPVLDQVPASHGQVDEPSSCA